MDRPVKITWKWGITPVPGLICWKNIFDLEISGGHFVFALQKFRPRAPKWHPADFCSGHPIVSESILKHRPYRETRFSENTLDYSGPRAARWQKLLRLETTWAEPIPPSDLRRRLGFLDTSYHAHFITYHFVPESYQFIPTYLPLRSRMLPVRTNVGLPTTSYQEKYRPQYVFFFISSLLV